MTTNLAVVHMGIAGPRGNVGPKGDPGGFDPAAQAVINDLTERLEQAETDISVLQTQVQAIINNNGGV